MKEELEKLVREAREIILAAGESDEVEIQFRQHGWLRDANRLVPIPVPMERCLFVSGCASGTYHEVYDKLPKYLIARPGGVPDEEYFRVESVNGRVVYTRGWRWSAEKITAWLLDNFKK